MGDRLPIHPCGLIRRDSPLGGLSRSACPLYCFLRRGAAYDLFGDRRLLGDGSLLGRRTADRRLLGDGSLLGRRTADRRLLGRSLGDGCPYRGDGN